MSWMNVCFFFPSSLLPFSWKKTIFFLLSILYEIWCNTICGFTRFTKQNEKLKMLLRMEFFDMDSPQFYPLFIKHHFRCCCTYNLQYFLFCLLQCNTWSLLPIYFKFLAIVIPYIFNMKWKYNVPLLHSPMECAHFVTIQIDLFIARDNFVCCSYYVGIRGNFRWRLFVCLKLNCVA